MYTRLHNFSVLDLDKLATILLLDQYKNYWSVSYDTVHVTYMYLQFIKRKRTQYVHL